MTNRRGMAGTPWQASETTNLATVALPALTTFTKGDGAGVSDMAVPITLPVRSWAVLDAALAFFRSGPETLANHFPLVRDCQALHDKLARLGIQQRYERFAGPAPDRPLLRLHVVSTHNLRQHLRLHFTEDQARGLALACWQVIDALTTLLDGVFLEHEVDEIECARAFLSEFRRLESPMPFADGRGLGLLRWIDARNQYEFDVRTSHRVRAAFLQQRASLN